MNKDVYLDDIVDLRTINVIDIREVVKGVVYVIAKEDHMITFYEPVHIKGEDSHYGRFKGGFVYTAYNEGVDET